MSLRIRRSFKLAPGFRLNLGRRGGSVSIGERGASVNVSLKPHHHRARARAKPKPIRAVPDDFKPDPDAKFTWTGLAGDLLTLLFMAAFALVIPVGLAYWLYRVMFN